ncbi:hypothetical protein H310_15102 [Aphanomyces invadans]|uniref:Uncharacterized protein n=1 Tax=Aphanomyces invadans TaxID=157072 RepID=A0A024T800_9STRA|nr:hypothetical protein H310_15102 [Aphanomyces invadans]ETV90068.1 hypothetical protein H310_15102 [Aphanomyces invadans]|eukprot:XP_008881301.1 hypothetical protein H310_15102 [Aphanomyces invadans]
MPRLAACQNAVEAELRQRWCVEFAIEEANAIALKRRVAELEGLVHASDALVTKAIAAKAEVESKLIQQCVALLNTKKVEIQRLQTFSKSPSHRQHIASPPASDEESTELSGNDGDDVAEVASQAYSQVPVPQTHLSAKQVLNSSDDDFLDML